MDFVLIIHNNNNKCNNLNINILLFVNFFIVHKFSCPTNPLQILQKRGSKIGQWRPHKKTSTRVLVFFIAFSQKSTPYAVSKKK